MKKIPHSRGVNQSIRMVHVAIRKAIKGLNQKAGQLMARGDYASAESLVARGRELQQFVVEFEVLHKRWRQLTSGGQVRQKKPVTPLWAFYQPILKALNQCGGEATLSQIEPAVESVMESTFQPGDRAMLARGTERWKVAIRWARKHLKEEGWIQDRKGARWSITDAGRRAAEKGVGPS